jgi:hypothetical protein
VTLSALEVLPAASAPKGPKNFRATTTGNGIYNLTWEIPAGASYDRVNILSRMSGQTESVPSPAATSFVFEQEIAYESTNNEAFVLQARSGNIFYAQRHAGAGVGPLYINAGGAGEVNGATPTNNTLTRSARGFTWVTDLGYCDPRHQFVGPLLSGDRNAGNWNTIAFGATVGSPAYDLDPPFAMPDNLTGDELILMREIRWTWSTPTRDPVYMPMVWDVPINDGTYLVRLYFGEGCCPPPTAVQRAVDVACETSDPKRIYYNGIAVGDTPPDDREYVEGSLDPVALFGTVTLLEFEAVAVDDGFLSIVFSSFAQFGAPYDNNPMLSAIEILPSGGPPPELFKRGDVNADDTLNIADPISLLSHLFGGLPAPPCPDAADGNNDGSINIADAVSILGHLFGGTGNLPAPFGACGPDVRDDTLGPCDFPPCKP